jgi:hypothetical protein
LLRACFISHHRCFACRELKERKKKSKEERTKTAAAARKAAPKAGASKGFVKTPKSRAVATKPNQKR